MTCVPSRDIVYCPRDFGVLLLSVQRVESTSRGLLQPFVIIPSSLPGIWSAGANLIRIVEMPIEPPSTPPRHGVGPGQLPRGPLTPEQKRKIVWFSLASALSRLISTASLIIHPTRKKTA